METKNKSGFVLSVAAAITLLVGGIVLTGHFLNLIPPSGNIEAWKFVVYGIASLGPVLAGGFWLGSLYRRSRSRGDRPGIGNGIVFGVLLILVGLFILSFSAGIFPEAWRSVFISWPMILVVLGFIELFKLHIVPGLMLLTVGNFFLVPRIAALYPASRWFGETFVSTYWPMLLIAGGLLIILAIIVRPRYFRHRSAKWSKSSGECGESYEKKYGDKYKHAYGNYSGNETADGTVDYNFIFTGAEQVFLAPVFRGGEINTVFGGMTLDLRRTTLPEGVTRLEISAVFGGLTILAPAEWLIELHRDSIFGGFNDNRPQAGGPVDESRRLIIKASSVFGGGEVK